MVLASINRSIEKSLLLLVLLLSIISVNGQPALVLPDYDSVSTINQNNKVCQREYFLKKQLQCRVIYANASKAIYNLVNLYVPVKGYDSCYIYYKNQGQNVFLYNDSVMVNDQFSASSLLYKHKMINRKTNVLIEQGNYYLERFPMEEVCYNFEPKYRIGRWQVIDAGLWVDIDYDKYLINGKPIYFQSNVRVLNAMKKKCDSVLFKVLGKSFVNENIRFNLDKSTFSTKIFPRSPYKSTLNKLLLKTDETLEFADLCYDIVLHDTLRFTTILFRIDKNLRFVVEQQHDIFSNEFKYPCSGLDTTLNATVFKKLRDIKKLAANNGFNVNSPYFSINFKWEYTQGMFGKLKMELKDIKPLTPYQRLFKIAHIDLATGIVTVDRDDMKSFDTIEKAEPVRMK